MKDEGCQYAGVWAEELKCKSLSDFFEWALLLPSDDHRHYSCHHQRESRQF